MSFFVLRNPKAGRGSAVTDFLPISKSRMGDAPRCPLCGRFVGMMPLRPPVAVELEAWGSQWGEIAFGPGDQILISDKLKNAFVLGGLKGFTRLDAVRVIKTRKHTSTIGPQPAYELASIQRGGAAVDESRSGLVRDAPPACEECRTGGIVRRIDRLILEPNTWTGEDIFFARGLPGIIITSERFKRFCADHSLSNCCLLPAQDFSFDFYR